MTENGVHFVQSLLGSSDVFVLKDFLAKGKLKCENQFGCTGFEMRTGGN